MPLQTGQRVVGKFVYIHTPFNPQTYGLTRTETQTLLAQVPALRATDDLYFLQKGGERNRRMQRLLERVARQVDSQAFHEYQTLVSFYGAPFDESGRKVKPTFSREEWIEIQRRAGVQEKDLPYDQLISDEEAARGANVFVNETDMDDKQFNEWASKLFEHAHGKMSEVERSARVNPLLDIGTRVVVRGSKGNYGIARNTNWSKYPYADKIAESLWEAGKVCEKELPRYSFILKATGRGVLTGNFDARDMSLTFYDSRLYTFGGVTEEYVGSSLGWNFVKKGAHDLIVGVKNPALTEKIKATRSKVPDLVRTLPEDLRNSTIADVNMDAIDIAFASGLTQHMGYTIAARNWPNDPLLNALYPYIVLHTSEAKIRIKYIVRPTAEALLPEGEKLPDDERFSALSEDFTIGHEFDHSVGKRKIYDQALEEGKATAGSVWHRTQLGYTQAETEEFCKAIAPNIVRTIRMGSDLETGAINEAHAIGENVLFEKCLAAGAIEVVGGRLEVRPVKMVGVAGEYFVEAVRLEAGTSQEAIDAYLAPYRKLSNATSGLIRRLDDLGLPKTVIVDRGTVEEFEARLREHLKTLA